ncbi:MAG: Tryptophan--tRNA ligase [Syntrophorhabdaceae bacterium PtaU1.Bin034]|nr:MAG: Tryptophan--tRNA ligase [Syntrophorhabdaceae bacterium PtaU1.Bin034]
MEVALSAAVLYLLFPFFEATLKLRMTDLPFEPKKKRVFSGVAPTGVIHLGNYLGAVRNWVELQADNECFFSVVDLHALTTHPVDLKDKVIEVAKIYLACGLDPGRSVIFVQSHIKEHAELFWLLATIARIPELERMTQYKDKSGEDRRGVTLGLLAYPVLMAADILLYKADLVPVGEDQRQHVELTRDLAKRFNDRFGTVFPVPEIMTLKMAGRIMGLDNPEKKMSKTAASQYNYIALTDPPDAVAAKIGRAVTDSGREVVMSPEKPAISNLLAIYSLVSGQPAGDIEETYRGKGYAEFKKDLADLIIEFLRPIQLSYSRLDDKNVLSILRDGATRARKIAAGTVKEAREKLGLLPS